MPESKYDCIVIGSGPGGYVAVTLAFAVLAMLAFKILGGIFGALIGLFMTVVWFAFLGFVFYTILKIFAPGGGFVFNTVHNILPEVPPENIVAMFDAIDEYNRAGG